MSKLVEEYRSLIEEYNQLEDKTGIEAEDLMEDLDYLWSQMNEEEQKEFKINIVPPKAPKTQTTKNQEDLQQLLLNLTLANMVQSKDWQVPRGIIGDVLPSTQGNKAFYTEEYVNAKINQAYKAGFQDGLVEGSGSYRDYYNENNDDTEE